jgi:hypothetical protein
LKDSIPSVLVTAYNRADTTAKVLDAVRTAGAPRVYFYADAPATQRDAKACAEVRKLGSAIEREAELSRFFPESNLGPRNGVARAISWFFENEPEGIILEHDCLPSPDFFRYATEMLARYRYDTRIMHVAGMAPYPVPRSAADYYFIRIPLVWGWASWRRAWQYYDLDMRTLAKFRASGDVAVSVDGKRARANWMHYFHAAAAGNLQTWDYPWTYTVMRNHGYCITPVNNMISNIGFGRDAVHCRNPKSRFANMPVEPLRWPLRHPTVIRPSVDIEKKLNRDVFRHKTLKYLLELCGAGRAFAESKATRQLASRMLRWIE